MLKHINKLKEKPEKIRKQYMSFALFVCMTIVVSIWIWGISYKISSNNKKEEVAKTEVDKTSNPFSLLFGGALDAYNNIKASALDASVSLDKMKEIKKSEEETKDSGKVIDLIPVEYIEQ